MSLRTVLEPLYFKTRWLLLLYNLIAPKVQVSSGVWFHPDPALVGTKCVPGKCGEVAVGCLPITPELFVLTHVPRHQTPDITRRLQKGWRVRVWAYKPETVSFDYFLDLL